MASDSGDPAVIVAEMLRKLSIANEDERRDLLIDARAYLYAPDAGSKIKKDLESGDIAVIFDCLNSKEESGLKAACDILSRVFDFIDGSVLLQKYPSHLKRALSHPSTDVREMVLTGLKKSLNSQANVILFTSNSELSIQTAKAILDPDLSVAKQSTLVLQKLATLRDSNNKIILFNEPFTSVLKESFSEKDLALQLRVLDLMVKVSAMSEEHLERVAREGFLQKLVDLLKRDDDVLVQLNCIELVTELAESNHGFCFLESQNILGQTDIQLNAINSGPMAHFLKPGFVKFFGRIAHHKPSDFREKYPNFTSILMEMLDDSQDLEASLLALEVWGHIAMRFPGKQLLAQNNDLHNRVYQVLRKFMSHGRTEFKVRALGVFSDMIAAPEHKACDNKNEALAERLFDDLEPNAMDKMFNFAKQPITEISAAAYHVLLGSASYSWGLTKILNTAGMIEYLLDRSTAKDKEAKDRKYALVSAISGHVEAGNIFPPEILRKLQVYVRQGSCYIEATVDVALEEEQ